MEWSTGHIGFVAKAALWRKIDFIQYSKPHVPEYPPNAYVLNPKHTAQVRQQLKQQAIRGAEDEGDRLAAPPANHRSRRPKSATDDDDPRYVADEELICNDSKFYGEVLMLTWRNALRNGGVGAGLMNLGNTCYLNSILQAIAHTPPLAQYMCLNYSVPLSSTGVPNAPADFAFFLGDTCRRVLGRSTQVVKPALITSNLRAISKSLRVGQQADAHEFFVYLMQAVQTSILFRVRGGKKLPLRISTTTPLLRIIGGHLRSQVSWSRNDEIQMLRKAHQTQAATDLEMSRVNHPLDALHSNTYDPFTVLSLTIRGHTLGHCLDEFCRVEQLDGRIYQSPRKVGVRATKCFRIHVPPPVLTIQLKRFDAMRAKVSKKIDYPSTLDIAPYCSEGLAEYGGLEAQTVYDLCAVVVHEGGSLSYGHYYAFVKLRNQLWACCNDEQVRIVPEDVALRQQAYMLFYTKREAALVPAQQRPSGTSSSPLQTPRNAPPPSVAPLSFRILTDEEAQSALLLRQKEKSLAEEPKAIPEVFLQRSSPALAQQKAPVAKPDRRRYDDEDSDEEPVDAQKQWNSAMSHKMQCKQSTDSDQSVPKAPLDNPKRASSASPRLRGCASPSSPPTTDVLPPTSGEPLPGQAVPAEVAQLRGADVIRARKNMQQLSTVERPRHFDRMRTRTRDEQWDAIMDTGRVKKVRRKEEGGEDDQDKPNMFQNSGLKFDNRGRRLGGQVNKDSGAYGTRGGGRVGGRGGGRTNFGAERSRQW